MAIGSQSPPLRIAARPVGRDMAIWLLLQQRIDPML